MESKFKTKFKPTRQPLLHRKRKTAKSKQMSQVSPNISTSPSFSSTPKNWRSLTSTPSPKRIGHSRAAKNTKNTKNEKAYQEHFYQTFLGLKFIDTLPDKSCVSPTVKALPKTDRKRTIVFDLDETLVHCCEQMPSQVVLSVKLPNGQVGRAGINVRPFARECLRAANQLFEVIVFTASHKCYADVVLDYLDPTGELIQHRLYRDDCFFVNGAFVKDLRVFGNRNIRDIVIVDNAVYSFGYQIDNGIPIISWKDDPSDRELFNLIGYMQRLAKSKSMTKVNRKTFKLKHFFRNHIRNSIN